LERVSKRWENTNSQLLERDRARSETGLGTMNGENFVVETLKEEKRRAIIVDAIATPSRLPLWKRALDIALILLFLPGLLIVGTIVALIVKFGSRGPILFRQKRVGYKGTQFTCFKFRTMEVNAETVSHRNHTEQLIRSQAPMVKLDAQSDPRLVPFGTVLRATGLDELPQLLNVLRGDMSIVGPRPCIPYEYDLYEPWQRARFNAVPGLTGLWQVSGKNRTTFNEMIRFDIE
jgi:lipopolysaccharide/colanic/teichoic acid biosynthesis glycosyltransferase